ncbi:MAG: 6-carboxytetrahydropterin synthase [Verrucomicrobia bacterium]|nr:MAG: 6-carboxytetrahydropterin synthase [Verrucomicrobiota bacterium]
MSSARKKASTRPRPRSQARGDDARAAGPAAPGPVVVTRTVHFNAAHRLHNPRRSARWNRATFGECNHPNWHGHNYTVEVSVIGEPDPDTGYVVDLGRLRDVLQREIVARCDHRNLNLDVDFLEGIIPSAENLAVAFWRQIEAHIPRGRLYRVCVRETDNNRAEYYGPGGPPAR